MKCKEKSWVDENGCVLSEAELKEASRGWSAKTWEEFLGSTVEAPLQESLLESFDLENTKGEFREIYQNMIAQEEYPHLKDLVGSLIKKLTPREQEVVYAIFWEGKSQHEVARELGIKRSVVRNYRDHGLKKLGVLFVSNILSPKGNPEVEANLVPMFTPKNLQVGEKLAM